MQTVHFQILNKRLTVPLRVWSLTGHEPLRWDRPRRLFDLVQFLFGVWIRLDQIRTRCERFWTASGSDWDSLSVLRFSALHSATRIAHISREGGDYQHILITRQSTSLKIPL